MSMVNVATQNSYNLVKPGVSYYNKKPYGEEEFNKKIEWLANMLTSMQVDVVGFQEVFHKEALEAVMEQRAALRDMQVIVLGDTGDQPVVGLATRLPTIGTPTLIETIPDNARLHFHGQPVPIDTFSRPILRTKIQFPDIGKVTVYVVHLKSKRPEIPEGADGQDPIVQAMGQTRALIRRAVEAMGLRSILVDELQGRTDPVIVLGDCNDAATAVTTTIITGEPPWRRLPLAQKLPVWDRLLHNSMEIQTRQSLHGAYYTHIYNGHYESLDHVLLSDEFSARNPKRVGDIEYVRVFTDHLLDDTMSSKSVPRWQSDHGGVLVTLRTRAVA